MADSRELFSKDASEIETVAENHLRKQVIRRARHAHTQPKIDFPLRREIQIDRRKNLLLLLADGVETRDWTERAVILDSNGNSLGEIVTELEVGREHQPLIYSRTMKRPVKRGIEGEIPAADLPIHNWANLPRPGIGRISAALPADFFREADDDRQVELGRNTHAGTDMAANVIPSLTVFRGSENVKPGLEPVVEAVSYLDRFVQLVVGRKSAIIGRFAALICEFRQNLTNDVARPDDLAW